MDIHIHKIQTASWLMQKLELELSYKNKQQAIDAVKEALVKNEIKLSIEEEGNKTRFLNESGGELAVAVPVKNALSKWH